MAAQQSKGRQYVQQLHSAWKTIPTQVDLQVLPSLALERSLVQLWLQEGSQTRVSGGSVVDRDCRCHPRPEKPSCKTASRLDQPGNCRRHPHLSARCWNFQSPFSMLCKSH